LYSTSQELFDIVPCSFDFQDIRKFPRYTLKVLIPCKTLIHLIMLDHLIILSFLLSILFLKD